VLGRGSSDERAGNLATVLDGYFVKGGHHVNINVLNKDMLEDAVQVRAHAAPLYINMMLLVIR
jgi:formate C-acetyltransferase